MQPAKPGINEGGLGLLQLTRGHDRKFHAVSLAQDFGRRDPRVEGHRLAMENAKAAATDQIAGSGRKDQIFMIAFRTSDDLRVSEGDPGVSRRKRVPPIAKERAKMISQRGEAIAHIIAAASGDPRKLAPIMRHRIGLQRFALDDPRISIARLATGLAPINQRDRPAAALQMHGCRRADHTGAENDRASHRLQPAVVLCWPSRAIFATTQ